MWTALLLALPAAAIVAFGVGRSAPYGLVWAAAVAVVGVTVAGALLDAAPPSRGRLRQSLDDLDLTFYALTAEDEGGHSWCRPTCPFVERTYRAPMAAPAAALLDVAGAMVRAHLIDEDAPVFRALPRDRFTVTRPNQRIDVHARLPGAGQRVIVVIRAVATR